MFIKTKQQRKLLKLEYMISLISYKRYFQMFFSKLSYLKLKLNFKLKRKKTNNKTNMPKTYTFTISTYQFTIPLEAV